jgi:4-amino-4-deoxy-L-arabinose transferase-like glycosyltransferase
VLVLLAARVAREAGGGRSAQALAALAVAANPLFLRAGNLFQPVVLDQLTWTLALLALLRLCSTRDDRWWLAVGAAMGLGLLVKFSIVFLGAGVLLATLATPHRRSLLGPWPWYVIEEIAVVLAAWALMTLAAQWWRRRSGAHGVEPAVDVDDLARGGREQV